MNKQTGRLTTTFDENPQLPFNDVSLNFKAGARAPLVTPASCEPQTTEADFYSWAQPDDAGAPLDVVPVDLWSGRHAVRRLRGHSILGSALVCPASRRVGSRHS